MLATFIGLQSGTLFVYQGQELGMANLPQTWPIEEYKDVETQGFYQLFVNPHHLVIIVAWPNICLQCSREAGGR